MVRLTSIFVMLLSAIALFGKTESKQKIQLIIPLHHTYPSASGTYSISVCDADVVGIDSLQPNAKASILLTSDIRGKIEEPNHYFDSDDAKTDAELDLLMLTQGWRRYPIDSIISAKYPNIKHNFEKSQSISGHIERTLRKHPKGMGIMLFSPRRGQVYNFELGDSSCFVINDLDIIRGEMLTIQAVKDGEAKKFTQLYIDDETFPMVDLSKYNKISLTQKVDSFASLSSTNQQTFDFDDYILLNDIEVSTRVATPRNRTKIEPFRLITEDDSWLKSNFTMEVLLQSLCHPKKIYDPDTGDLLTLYPIIYVDDFEVTPEEFFNTVVASQVSQIEYFKPLDTRLLVFGQRAVRLGAVFVYTKETWRMKKNDSYSLSFQNVSPLGYNVPVEFYSPQYIEEDKSVYVIPDQRTTLYWNPSIKVGDDGKAVVSFYNSDKAKRYLIVIEGVSDAGEIISQQMIIEP